MADEKRRAGRDVPFLNWRYILFKWNDSDEEMDAARRSSPTSIGVDRLCLGAHRPSRGQLLAAFRARLRRRSRRSATRCGTTATSGNAIPGATPRAQIEVRTLVSELLHCARATGRSAARSHARPEPVGARVSRAGDLRPASRAPWRAALRRAGDAVESRFRARVAAQGARPWRTGRCRRLRFPHPSSPAATR